MDLIKCLLVSIFISFFITVELFSQEVNAPWSLGVSVVKSEYRGDLGHNLFDWEGTQYYGAGLQVKHYINSAFDIGLDMSVSDLGYRNDLGDQFLSQQIQGSLRLQYKFNNGYLLSEASKVAPYLQAGVGYTMYNSDPKRGANLSVINIPLTLGIKFRMSPRISLFIQSTYHLTDDDTMDMLAGDVNTNNMVNGNDHFLNHQMGLTFSLGNKTKKLDVDGDGFTDFEDACPKVFGVAAMQGCPDTDRDGIKDSEDPCPNQSGSLAMGGCPDTDQDGLADHEDECPVNAGSIALRGCPDSDGDGVTDAYDNCPHNAGSLTNKGCPKIEPSTRDLMKKANEEVKFVSESAKFQETAIEVLQEILSVLEAHPYYELIIESHVFNESKEDAFELKLSQDRADVIKEFLVTNGINSEKIIAVGYGSFKPHYFNQEELQTEFIERLEFKINF